MTVSSSSLVLAGTGAEGLVPAAGRSADGFYAEMVRRNHGLISPADQQRLRRSSLLVAGCGSVGGAAVEPLVRLGAERLVLAEPGSYELSNLNRQRATVADLGRNKAVVHAGRAAEINPFAQVTVVADGITGENVGRLVKAASVILDGVDVTAQEAIRHKVALHVEAARAGVPVVSGYDVAGLQALVVYDYQQQALRPLAGRVRPEQAAGLSPAGFLSRVVPRAAIPLEILGELPRLVAGTGDGFPQLVYTADLFGVLAARAVGELLAGRPVRAVTVVDVHRALRPAGARMRTSIARWAGLARLRRTVRAARRETGPPVLPAAGTSPTTKLNPS